MTDQTYLQAWVIDRQLRLRAVPVDRRVESSHWYTSETVFPTGDDLIALFWEARVPGSGAPEIPYVEMVESMANRGYDMRTAEALLPEGLRLAKAGDRSNLRALTAQLLAAIHSAPPDTASPYWQYEHPAKWEAVLAAMDPALAMDPAAAEAGRRPAAIPDLDERILAGWLGQLAGGAFGTAIEGYHFLQIRDVYGRIDAYLTTPETMNDDVTYELVFLDVFERYGRALTSVELGLEWLRQIPFGWSAEWVALHNLQDGLLPPDSGSFRNPYSDWIGAQMRGMVCGMLAPGWPLEAARLAHLDAVVSHAANGVYGEMYAAVLTSLAFIYSEPRELVVEALRFLPQKSEYVHVARECLKSIRSLQDPERAWETLDQRFERYNWIHAYPNLAADLLSLWHSDGDLTKAFSWLAFAGLDVDCNAGLVGNVLGVMQGVPAQWSEPLNDTLETYLPGKERLSIRELAGRTARLARVA
jgi:ADP-ribosylglycohydrolase